MGNRRGRPTSGGRGAADLFVAQFVDEDLGNAAHLVGSRTGKIGAVIDPLRDVDSYLDAADRYGVQIAHALDTHLHNDFLSGCRELAEETDAEIGMSADARVEFPHRPLREGDRVDLGAYALDVLGTPGHTPEHISFLLRSPGGSEPLALFSGGSLIVGGAARTDLLGPENTDTLTRQLYRTIHEKLLALPDGVVVYPTHGAGSFCVAPGSEDRVTTIGQERGRNPLAQAREEGTFVRRALDGLPSYPSYFREMRPINRRGPTILRGVPSLKALSPEEVDAWRRQGGAIVDVRSAHEFLHAHLPMSYGIPLDAPLVTWAGWLVPYRTPLVLVARTPHDLEEATRQLVRIGFDDLRGHLKGGVPAWSAAGLPVERTPVVAPANLRRRLASADPPVVLDVRRDDEWAEGHLPGAIHIENGDLPTVPLSIPRDRPVVVHCAHWNRSTAGLSVLARRGLKDLALLEGGFAAWESLGLEVVRGSGA